MMAGAVERTVTLERAARRPVKIAVVTGGIPHYRWPFFTELADRGATVHLIASGKLPPGIIATRPADPRITLSELASARPRWRSDVVADLNRFQPDVILLEHGAALDYTWTTLLARSVSAPRDRAPGAVRREARPRGMGTMGPAAPCRRDRVL
jgi:hypothetical protein